MTSAIHESHDPANTSSQPGNDSEKETTDTGAPPRINDLIAAVEERMRTQRLPLATYRAQFNNRCSFAEIESAVPYLYTLGISDLYASPFLKARPGSPHGYDIVDHSAVNPEIGTLDDLRSLRSALREHDMGLLADVVPNHMSATPHLNDWWNDVLENGPSSQFATHFDIDWMPLKPDLANKVLLPVLGDQFGKVLEDGQLKVQYSDGAFWLHYYDRRFPLAPRSCAAILTQRLDEKVTELGAEHESLSELLSILTAIRNLPLRTETAAERIIERRREKEVVKRRLQDLTTRSPEIADFVQANVTLINGIPGNPESFDTLDALLQDQAYRLAYWRAAADEINYRRFFDINELAAICTEHPQVFADSHQLLLNLLDEGTITGLRIDHPDGLYDPLAYLLQLQEHQFLRFCRESAGPPDPASDSPPDENSSWTAVENQLRELWHSATLLTGSPLARPLYVVVEKILALHEPLPEDWPVHGTVGYEFLNALNGLFVDPRSERTLSALYARITGQSLDFQELASRCKHLIVRMSMASELSVLGHQLDRISERNRLTRDFTLNSLTRALEEVITGFRVYRTYLQPGRVNERDRRLIEQAILWAKRRNPAMDASIFDFVSDVLLLRSHIHAGESERLSVEQIVGKFQQLTGPIMAKAVEDTAFYRFNRLVSLNEVGGEPAHWGTSPDEFHLLNQARLPRQSHGLNATSTHDTKRSEDVRARISVLSEIPKVWREHVQRWFRWHRKLKTIIDGSEAPSRNAEYLLYQTLIGTWPDTIPEGDDLATYVTRLQQYMLKVVREAKQDTSWVSPNEPYEAALMNFVAAIFEDRRRQSFVLSVHDLASKVAENGRWNSLSQLVLKVASPGVPDFYQGTELWNLRLVDPDNRAPVDLPAIRAILDQLLDSMGAALNVSDRGRAVDAWIDVNSPPDESTALTVSRLLEQLLTQRPDGRIKLLTTLLTLRARRRCPELWTSGDYEPLKVTGPQAAHVIAFARRHREQQMIVIVPRLTVAITGLGGPPPLGEFWVNTSVSLPESFSTTGLRDLFSRRQVRPTEHGSEQNAVLVADVLRDFPVAILFSNL